MKPLIRLLLALMVGAGVVHHAAADSGGFRAFKAEPETWDAGTWAAYKAKFVRPEGRVVDDANGEISHSEGQGYGMLLAVLADDRAAFESIWAWTKKELMKRPDGLTSWKWEAGATPNITDPNNASDGDLLIAWALVEAADRWSLAELRQEAVRLVTALDKVTGARSRVGRVFLPGANGFSAKEREDGPVVNPSYWVFPAFERLKPLAPGIDWDGHRASGYTLLRIARFGAASLPTDWVSLAKDKPQPAEGFPPRFSYNAIRVPLYLAWAEKPNKEALRPFVSFAELYNQKAVEYDVTTSKPEGEMGGKGYLAVLALAKCAFDDTPMPPSLRSVSLDQYYPTTLHMLALAAARLRLGKCLLGPR